MGIFVHILSSRDVSMWKESYRLGVQLIDSQHMALFKMVGNLIDVVQSNRSDKKKECIAAISYMKGYTLKHFSDEEAYQKKIGYAGYAEHKNIHKKFTQTVLNHERRMLQSDFNEKSVKDFMGTLIAWLVYHVAGTDQQIVADKGTEYFPKRNSPIHTYFRASTCDILNKMTGLNINDISTIKQTIDDLQSVIVVKLKLNGDASGVVTYKYTKRLAFDLMHNMASFTPNSIDQLVCSAMLEISNIISVAAVGRMLKSGFSCNINTPVVQVHPAFLTSTESVIFDTGLGILEMAVMLD